MSKKPASKKPASESAAKISKLCAGGEFRIAAEMVKALGLAGDDLDEVFEANPGLRERYLLL